jgi:hypothetical protein
MSSARVSIGHRRYRDVIPSIDLVDHELSRVQHHWRAQSGVLLARRQPVRRGAGKDKEGAGITLSC